MRRPVYPREVVKAALACNAAAVIWYTTTHPACLNRAELIGLSPSGYKRLWLSLKYACWNHLVIGTEGHVSMAERGWL